MKNRGWLAFLVGGCALSFLYLSRLSDIAESNLLIIFGIGSVAAMILGLRMNHPKSSLPWLMLTFGQAGIAAGNVIYSFTFSFERTIFPQDFSFLVYALGVVLFLISTTILFIQSRRSIRRDEIVLGLIIAISVAVMIWVLLLEPYAWRNLRMDQWLGIIAFPTGILVISVTISILLMSPIGNTWMFRLTFAGLLFYSLSLFFFGRYLFQQSYFGTWSLDNIAILDDAASSLGGVFLGSAFLHPSFANFGQLLPLKTSSISKFDFGLLAATFCLAPTAFFVQSSSGMNPSPIPVLVGMVVVFLLIEWRLARSTRILESQNLQLSQQQDLLRRQTFELSTANTGLQGEIRERKKIEKKLTHDALHDWLTGLPNRVLFVDRLGQAIEYSQRRGESLFSVAFLDLDEFKVINDSLGHNIGDKLLIAMAGRLSGLIRSSDTVARFGGDEFVFLLEDTSSPEAVSMVANRIHQALEEPFNLDGQEMHISGSMGVVTDVSVYQDPDSVLRDADIAMYQAKSQGKSHTEIFIPGMRSIAISRLELENDLRSALKHGEFMLYYQPIFDLTGIKLMGFEALARWNHPHRGLILPNEFIPLAEETGLIEPLGKWILLEACGQMKKWQDEIPGVNGMSVSVNISSRQLMQMEFVSQIQQTLVLTGLDPSSLKLEITESVLIENQEMANRIFTELNSLGVRFDIDDFGTGYSSLRYLRNFPIHTIKIDRSFISDMDQHGKDVDLIRAIILMARDLGMHTIAEGIETESQLSELVALSCQAGQGFFLARPMPAESIADFLVGMLGDRQPS